MGSRGGTLRGLDLQAYKNGLKLTSVQTSVLIGCLLGDGTLRLGIKAVNANLKIEQGLAQKAYVWWKYNHFKEWVLTPPKQSHRYKSNGERYRKSWWFRTVRHPEISFFHNMFYCEGKKQVPITIGQHLDPLSLAVWVMDDGSFNRNVLDLSTYAFNKDSIRILQQVLWKKFSLKTGYFNDRNIGFRMYFPKNESKKISSIIAPFIIPSMEYKLPPLTP